MNRVLIVEDDISIAELQKDYLEINGFSAVICDNGLKALTLIKPTFRTPKLLISEELLSA